MMFTQIHRFRQTVAFTFAGSETVYLEPATARLLAERLNAYVESCETESFLDSTLGTFEMESK